VITKQANHIYRIVSLSIRKQSSILYNPTFFNHSEAQTHFSITKYIAMHTAKNINLKLSDCADQQILSEC